MVTHSDEVASGADRVVRMRDGRVVDGAAGNEVGETRARRWSRRAEPEQPNPEESWKGGAGMGTTSASMIARAELRHRWGRCWAWPFWWRW